MSSCSLILKMKLVPPSLPRSSYVSSSFGLYCSAYFSSLFVSILCTCCSHFSWYRLYLNTSNNINNTCDSPGHCRQTRAMPRDINSTSIQSQILNKTFKYNFAHLNVTMQKANKINNSFMTHPIHFGWGPKSTALSEVVSASLRTYFEIRWGSERCIL